MAERPVLFRHGGQWTARLYVQVHTQLVTFYCNKNDRNVACLREDFAAWMRENDPNHTALGVSHLLILKFDREDAAMLFRLTYDAEIDRD